MSSPHRTQTAQPVGASRGQGRETRKPASVIPRKKEPASATVGYRRRRVCTHPTRSEPIRISASIDRIRAATARADGPMEGFRTGRPALLGGICTPSWQLARVDTFSARQKGAPLINKPTPAKGKAMPRRSASLARDEGEGKPKAACRRNGIMETPDCQLVDGNNVITAGMDSMSDVVDFHLVGAARRSARIGQNRCGQQIPDESDPNFAGKNATPGFGTVSDQERVLMVRTISEENERPDTARYTNWPPKGPLIQLDAGKKALRSNYVQRC
ncbi:hypothetical protein CMUS01_08640 [Colletotrichum musicola]|uniref:Uncharacterized protein n=1 Tax=Colletotrichum musicola TaxID=2175873 RepID=A0A8H6KBH6_9PEZI|nr:hypothetical protein CMUS01_08640 [Colletotrichum musicola]